MPQTHTPYQAKIYGHGVSALLREAEIKAIFDAKTGELSIQLNKDTCLKIAGESNGCALKFHLESTRSPFESHAY